MDSDTLKSNGELESRSPLLFDGDANTDDEFIADTPR